MPKCLAAFLLLTCPLLAAAQTKPPQKPLTTLTSSQTAVTLTTMSWTEPNVTDAAAAQALEYRARFDGGAFLVVPGVSCTTPSANTAACTAKLTPAMLATLAVMGSHSVTLSAYAGGTVGLESAQSVPFVLAVGPDAPTGVQLVP